MELALLITNISLVVFTGVYVFLTYRLSRESAKTNIINQSFYKEQLRLSCMPLFSVNIPRQNDEFNIELLLENVGSFPAYDVDIWLISTVHNDDFPRNKLNKYIKGAKNKKVFEKIDSSELAPGSFYALFDRGCYATLQANNRVKISSTFIFHPYSLDLLIQYRDHIGNNYFQQYCLSYVENDSKRLIIDEIRPSSIKPVERFDLIRPHFDKDFKKIRKEKDENLPEELEYLYQLVKAGHVADSFLSKDISKVESKWEIEKF